jgi:glycosyltransferase involved in cell wall biosynthesis
MWPCRIRRKFFAKTIRNNKTMDVSVIVPTLNRKGKLSRALKSVYNQSTLPDELVLVDDASKKPVNKSDIPRPPKKLSIHLIRNESTRGPAFSRNKGVESSSCSIIMFLDDDDKWKSYRVENHLSIFKNNIDVGLVYSGVIAKRLKNGTEEIAFKRIPSKEGDIFERMLMKNEIGVTSAVSVKKSVFNRAGKFDESIPACEDYDLWIRCAMVSKVGADKTASVVYSYDDKSFKKGEELPYIKSRNIMISKYKQYAEKCGVFTDRKMKSYMYFRNASVMRRKSLIRSIPWVIKSLKEWPNAKAIILLMPRKVISFAKKLMYIISN